MDIGKRKYLIFIQTEWSADNGDGTFNSVVTEGSPLLETEQGQPVITEDGTNYMVAETYVNTPVFCSKKPLSQSRLLENGVTGLEGSVKFNILKNDFPLLSKIHRIRENADIYTIHSVTELENQKELEIIGTILK